MRISLSKIKVTLPPSDRTLFRIKALELPAGTHVVVTGASGRGKTTLLHLIAGLMTPAEGVVSVGPHQLTSMSDDDRTVVRRRSMGLVFQRLNLLDHLTLAENVILGLPREADPKKAIEALQRMGLGDRAAERSAALSLGEQQRIAVARVLAASPELILADEPTSSLDEANADIVMDALFETARGKTLVVVSHDRRLWERFPRRIDFEEILSP